MNVTNTVYENSQKTGGNKGGGHVSIIFLEIALKKLFSSF